MNLSREEFERLALEQLDMVDRMARTLTRNGAEAEDLVQETYLRALKASEGFDLREHGIRPWLMRILHNTHFTRAGREHQQPKAVESDVLGSVADPSAGGNMQWEASEELNWALEQLPPELKATLVLWAVDEFSYQEIAESMDVPIGTVMSRLYRGRQRLKELLPGAAKDSGNIQKA